MTPERAQKIVSAHNGGSIKAELCRVFVASETEVSEVLAAARNGSDPMKTSPVLTVVKSPAEEINALHASFCEGMRTNLKIAIQLGELLLKQKKECGHGNWLPWLKANVKFGEDSVQLYMGCYRNREKLKTDPNRYLTIKAAARRTPKKESPVILDLTQEPKDEMKLKLDKAKDIAAKNPGISVRELAKKTGVGHGTAQLALKSLKTESRVTKTSDEALAEKLKDLWRRYGHTLIAVETIHALFREFFEIHALADVAKAQTTWEVVRKELKLRGPEHNINLKVRFPSV